MKQPIQFIQDQLKSTSIIGKSIEHFQSNERVDDYLINQIYLFRISTRPLSEISKLSLIQTIHHVPHIYLQGQVQEDSQMYYYLLTDFIEGKDLMVYLKETKTDDYASLAKDITTFLLEMKSLKGDHYDIGFYVPTIPNVKTTWKEGHRLYQKKLFDQIDFASLSDLGVQTITETFAYFEANQDALNYQDGPILLHNDFHPKNIILKDNRFSGVIDWECSQYGEADFELAHLFHWSIYPFDGSISFEPLLKEIWIAYINQNPIPNLDIRLTIYQMEHELNKLVWMGKSREQETITRLQGWLSNQISKMISGWHL